jgi:hypothetical protein
MRERSAIRFLVSTAAAISAVAASGNAFAQTASQDGGAGFILLLVLIVVMVYGLPSFVAFYRGHPNRWPILIVNIVFGGTGLGWLGSLVWACSAVHRSPTGNHGGESGLNLFANDPVRLQIDSAGHIASSHRDPADELVRLKQLLDAGVIDEAEYRRLRAGPLNRLAERRT